MRRRFHFKARHSEPNIQRPTRGDLIQSSSEFLPDSSPTEAERSRRRLSLVISNSTLAFRNPRGSPRTQSDPLSTRFFQRGQGPRLRRHGQKCFQSPEWWSACALSTDKYISLMVSFVGAPRLGHRQSFPSAAFPLGFLPGFLICPLFPLSSPGCFPRNSKATSFFSLSPSLSLSPSPASSDFSRSYSDACGECTTYAAVHPLVG